MNFHGHIPVAFNSEEEPGIFQFNQHSQTPYGSQHFPLLKKKTIPKKRRDTVDTIVSDKKMKRIIANRRSASDSYIRRKERCTQLTAMIPALKKQNAILASENKLLRLEVESLQKQLKSLLSSLSKFDVVSGQSNLDKGRPLA